MKVLVVVDMQNDFIDGTLGTKEAQAIVPNVVKKIEEYRKKDYLIIATKDTHYHDYLNTLEGKNLPVEHCIYNTKGWEFIKGISESDFNTVFPKNTFGRIDLEKFIRDITIDEPDEIEVIGLCTDICVISNAIILKSSFINTPITVDASCCAGVTPESHKNALEAMKMCQINIINE